ncbi:LOW QUALITY PROTEIN: hypothetical protein BT93_H2195 [Corymbia citriodora subsp. variegata]|nr:LOW QUALITY PROTEIN: hypothetical protein BT93_H2195 [Corymbia citriodora subsp. variegata]
MPTSLAVRMIFLVITLFFSRRNLADNHAEASGDEAGPSSIGPFTGLSRSPNVYPRPIIFFLFGLFVDWAWLGSTWQAQSGWTRRYPKFSFIKTFTSRIS